jgi:DNA-binding transcriptional regulator YhcF (GntR family)
MVRRLTSRSMPRYRLAMPTARSRMPSHTSTNGTSTATRYRRVEAVLRDQIRPGEYRPGDRLHTEEDLVRDFGVSHPTVRRARHVLEQDSLHAQTAGRGTFINAIAAELPFRRRDITLDDLVNVERTAKVVLQRLGTSSSGKPDGRSRGSSSRWRRSWPMRAWRRCLASCLAFP